MPDVDVFQKGAPPRVRQSVKILIGDPDDDEAICVITRWCFDETGRLESNDAAAKILASVERFLQLPLEKRTVMLSEVLSHLDAILSEFPSEFLQIITRCSKSIVIEASENVSYSVDLEGLPVQVMEAYLESRVSNPASLETVWARSDKSIYEQAILELSELRRVLNTISSSSYFAEFAAWRFGRSLKKPDLPSKRPIRNQRQIVDMRIM